MKNFTKVGNQYKLKPQWGMNIPLIGAFVVLAIVGFTKMPESSFKWWMSSICIILFISVINSFMVIDLDKREIRVKMGIFARSKIIPFTCLLRFTVVQTKQYGLITINVTLIAHYINDKGKDKTVSLVQSFITSSIQDILNDINEILGDEYQR